MTNRSKKTSKTNKTLLKSKCYKKPFVVKLKNKMYIISDVLEASTILLRKTVIFIYWLLILILVICYIFFITIPSFP